MKRGGGVASRVPWAVPLIALVAAGVMLIVMSTIGGQLLPGIPTPVPQPTRTATLEMVEPAALATPIAINYAFYDWRNTDFGALHPAAGPLGSLHVVPWRSIHINDNQFDWRAIDSYLAAAQGMTVTLDDGTVISKPVIIEIVDNESAVPSQNLVDAPYPPLTSESPIFFFNDYTPSWVRDRMRQTITPITYVKSLDPLQLGQLTTDLGSYMAIGRPGASACGWPFVVFAPKYDNPYWLAAYKQMVYALGARYNGDARLTAIVFGPGMDTEYGHATKAYFNCDLKNELYKQSGMTENDYLDTVIKPGPLNDVADWYRDAFPTKPVYLQFTDAGKRMIDTLDASGHKPPIGLKQATLVEDNNNQWQSDGNGTLQLMMRYSMTHPIAWENARAYTGGIPRSLQVRYFTLLGGLMSFPGFMDFIGGWPLDEETYPTGMYDFERRFLGRTVTTTDEIWVAMRETTFLDATGGAIKYAGWKGDFTYGLYRPEGIPANQARVITTAGLLDSPFKLTYPITTHLYSLIARRTDIASGNSYMSFAADHRWQYWGRIPVAVAADGVFYDVTLKYVDLGTDQLAIEYMDYGGVARSRTIRKRDSGQWVTTTITLNDAYFNGQLAGGADFRINALPDRGGQDEIVHMVVVKAHAGAAPTPTPADARATRTPLPLYEQRVNAGGALYLDKAGFAWAADQPYTSGGWGYVGGSSYTAVRDVAGVDDPLLYKTEHYWPEKGAYIFDAVNGPYEVELRFTETLREGAARRLFDVQIEGVSVLQSFDIYATAGFYKPVTMRFRTMVNDGQLNIDFVARADSAKVDAVHVTYLRPELQATPPATPTALATRTRTPTPVVVATPTPTAVPAATPAATPTVTPTLTIEQRLTQLEERYRALDEALRKIIEKLATP